MDLHDFVGRAQRAQKAVAALTKEPPERCRFCDCTDDAACHGGCTWVDDALCSACIPVLLERLDELEASVFRAGAKVTWSPEARALRGAIRASGDSPTKAHDRATGRIVRVAGRGAKRIAFVKWPRDHAIAHPVKFLSLVTVLNGGQSK